MDIPVLGDAATADVLASNTSDDVTVVLVHGAWADGSSWAKVITALQADGVRVRAAPLPLTSLRDDVAALDDTLARTTGSVVLAGHAYGGAVIGSTRAAQVRALVYVAALAPDDGETVGDVFYRDEPQPQAPVLSADARGLIWLPDDAFAAAFAPQASGEEQTLLGALQRPISTTCISTPVGRPLWRDRSSWFLLATEDRMIPAPTQHYLAQRMNASVASHPVDHVPMVSAPTVVTELLRRAIDSVASS